MNWNDGRIVRIEIRDGKATVTDVPKDVTVVILNFDKDVDINSAVKVVHGRTS